MRIAGGAPLYISWSPDSHSLLIHQEGELFRSDIDAPERLLDLRATSGSYRAASWSPSSNEAAFLDSQALYIARDDGSRRRELSSARGMRRSSGRPKATSWPWDSRPPRMIRSWRTCG